MHNNKEVKRDIGKSQSITLIFSPGCWYDKGKVWLPVVSKLPLGSRTLCVSIYQYFPMGVNKIDVGWHKIHLHFCLYNEGNIVPLYVIVYLIIR